MQILIRAIGFMAFMAFMALKGVPVQADLYNPKTFTLDNGLQVVVVENHRAPVVTQMVWYRVGSADDPVGKSGLAHFLEHMMFKGPAGSAPAVLSKKVEALGGSSNAATSYDYTFYYETVASQHLEEIMRLESARMKELTILEKEAQTELQVILEERRMRTDNKPFGRFLELFHSQFFRHDPKRLPPIGWEHEIRQLTAADAKAFHEKWYAPQNAILFLGGDVTFEKAKVLAQKYYGPLVPRQVPPRERLQDPPHPKGHLRLDLEAPDVQVPYLIRAYPAPTLFDQGGKFAFSGDVLEHLLGETPTGFLHQELVEKKKVATFTMFYYPRDTLGGTYLLIACQPNPEVSLKDLESSLSQALQDFAQKALTPEGLQKAKQRLLAKLIYDQDSVLSGQDIPEGLIIGRPLEDLSKWDQKISDVTLDQVKDLYQQIFSASYRVTGSILPATAPTTSPESVPTDPSESAPQRDQKEPSSNSDGTQEAK